MSRGYIVIAQNNDTVDYLQQAYVCLKFKSPQNEVSNPSVCVEKGTKVPKKYRAILDKVIDIWK